MNYLASKLQQMTLTNKILVGTIVGWFALSTAALIYLRVAYGDQLSTMFY